MLIAHCLKARHDFVTVGTKSCRLQQGQMDRFLCQMGLACPINMQAHG